MEQFISITKALSDQNRVRALLALRKKELCVCQIIELLQLAPSTVSKHMSILKHALLVQSRKEGRWIYYKLREKNKLDILTSRLLDTIIDLLNSDDVVKKDDGSLSDILKLDIETICRKKRYKKFC